MKQQQQVSSKPRVRRSSTRAAATAQPDLRTPSGKPMRY